MRHLFSRSIILTLVISYASCSLMFAEDPIDMSIGSCKFVDLILSDNNVSVINLNVEYEEIISVEPKKIVVLNTSHWIVKVCSKAPGSTLVSALSENVTQDHEQSYLHVTVRRFVILNIIGQIIGWIYFAAWSVSFYPQIYENYVRKSVVGLNFDFLALNIVGFTAYSLYNCALFFWPAIEKEYYIRHPKSLNPVMFNDVFFSVHATVASAFTILQAFIYEKDNQKVSVITKFILVLYYTILLASGVSAFTGAIHWIDFFYCCSYIKLSITLIKYIPQAVMNYTRKSTVGWSIGNVLLDLTGGVFSFMQMVLQCYNYDDWGSLEGDFAKAGLGLVSIIFDLFFMYQHYVLYRASEYEEPITDNIVQNEPSTQPVGYGSSSNEN